MAWLQIGGNVNTRLPDSRSLFALGEEMPLVWLSDSCGITSTPKHNVHQSVSSNQKCGLHVASLVVQRVTNDE